jgi:hypothetical protein
MTGVARLSATASREGGVGRIWAKMLVGCGHWGGCGGLAKRPGSTGRLKRMGLAQLERKFIYFPNFIFSAKTIPGKPRNCLKALKILRKSQKFHKNFQR